MAVADRRGPGCWSLCFSFLVPMCSYATVGTQQMRVLGQNLVLPAGPSTVHPLFTLRCLQMSLWTFPASLPRPYEGFRSASTSSLTDQIPSS